MPGGHFKNTYELVNLGALNSLLLNKLHNFQCMGKIFQRVPLKLHIKLIPYIERYDFYIQCWKFKSSQIYKFVCIFEMPLLYYFSNDSIELFDKTSCLLQPRFSFQQQWMQCYAVITQTVFSKSLCDTSQSSPVWGKGGGWGVGGDVAGDRGWGWVDVLFVSSNSYLYSASFTTVL